MEDEEKEEKKDQSENVEKENKEEVPENPDYDIPEKAELLKEEISRVDGKRFFITTYKSDEGEIKAVYDENNKPVSEDIYNKVLGSILPEKEDPIAKMQQKFEDMLLRMEEAVSSQNKRNQERPQKEYGEELEDYLRAKLGLDKSEEIDYNNGKVIAKMNEFNYSKNQKLFEKSRTTPTSDMVIAAGLSVDNYERFCRLHGMMSENPNAAKYYIELNKKNDNPAPKIVAAKRRVGASNSSGTPVPPSGGSPNTNSTFDKEFEALEKLKTKGLSVPEYYKKLDELRNKYKK